MIQQPSPEKKAEWAKRAALKDAIVPYFFEVFTNKVELQCGQCITAFKRSLIPNLDEPTFACPKCGAKNWVPVTFETT